MDDGSRDRSAEIVRAFREQDRRVRLVRLKANAGETAATDAGIKAVRGRHVVVMDADLQNDPHDIPGMLAHLDTWDAVTGWRVNRAAGDSWVRRLSSRIANRVRNRLSEETIQDSGCTFRAFRRECLRDLALYKGLPPVHPDAAQDARVPRPRGAGEPSAAPLRRVQVRHRQPGAARVRGPAGGALDEGSAAALRDRRGRGRRGRGSRGEGAAGRAGPLGREAPARARRAGGRAVGGRRLGRAPGARGEGGRRRRARGGRLPPGAAPRGRGRHRDPRRQPSGPGRGVPARRPRLLHREAADPHGGRGAPARRDRRGDRARAPGRAHLPLSPGHHRAARAARRGRARPRALLHGPLRRVQAPAHGRGRDPDRRHPLLRSLRAPARARGHRGHRDAARSSRPRAGRLLVHHRGVRRRPRLRRGRLLRPRHLPRLRDRGRAGHARRRLRDFGSARARQSPRGDARRVAGAGGRGREPSRPPVPSRSGARSSCSSTRWPVAPARRWTCRRGWPRCAWWKRRSARPPSGAASRSPRPRSSELPRPPRSWLRPPGA